MLGITIANWMHAGFRARQHRFHQRHAQSSHLCHPDGGSKHWPTTQTDSLRDGFRIGFQHDKAHCRPATTNMQSAFMYPEPVVTYLESEQLANRIVGPFDSSLNIQVNRFRVIPKSNQSGKWRLILDLSYPPEHSVNDGIDPQWCSLRYATVDQAIGHILQLGGGALLAKVVCGARVQKHPRPSRGQTPTGHGMAGPAVYRYCSTVWSLFSPEDFYRRGRCIRVGIVARRLVMEYSLH